MRSNARCSCRTSAIGIHEFADPRDGIEGGEAYLFVNPSVVRSKSLADYQLQPYESDRIVLVSVLVPRVRTIGIWLSAKEYAAVKKFCVKTGARSISDLARAAILGVVAQAVKENARVLDVDQNETTVRALETKVDRLSRELATLKAGLAAGKPHKR
jgi:hypothetical protein